MSFNALYREGWNNTGSLHFFLFPETRYGPSRSSGAHFFTRQVIPTHFEVTVVSVESNHSGVVRKVSGIPRRLAVYGGTLKRGLKRAFLFSWEGEDGSLEEERVIVLPLQLLAYGSYWRSRGGLVFGFYQGFLRLISTRLFLGHVYFLFLFFFHLSFQRGGYR